MKITKLQHELHGIHVVVSGAVLPRPHHLNSDQFSAIGIPTGDATNLGGGCYRLTNNSNGQRGAVWYVGTVDVSVSWEMTADVYLGNNNNGADGMVFVLRDLGAPNLGGRWPHGVRRELEHPRN